METIEVGYSHIQDGYYHKYLLYTEANGTQLYGRGGPSQNALGLLGDWLGSSTDGVGFGNISTIHGPYLSDTIDYDKEHDDPHELIVSGANLSQTWAKIEQALDAIQAEHWTYHAFGPNSNSVVDSALVRAGLPQPQRDDLFDAGDHWAPGSGILLNTAPNTYTDFSGTPGELVERIVGGDPGISWLSDGLSYVGAKSAVSYVSNLKLGSSEMISGVLFTSGDGTPPLTNTSTGYGTNLNLPGDAQLTSIVNSVFPQNPSTFDASVLTFKFSVNDPAIKSILVDVIFGSDEFPEYVDSFVDIGAVILNGQDIALFNSDQTKPLSVLTKNLNSGAFQDNQSNSFPIEYDGISKKLTITGLVHQGVNTIKIAVADTGDHILDSGLFVSNLRRSEFSPTGIKIQIDAGANTDLPNTLNGTNADEFFVAGGGDDIVFAGGGDDIIDLGPGNDVAFAGPGNDQILGGFGDDVVFGEDGNDTVIAGDGNGNDTYDGGSGIDTIVYLSTTKGIAVNLQHGQGSGVEIGVDKIHAIENVVGGSGNDQITGDSNDNQITGGLGNDVLDGADGNDTAIFGGSRSAYTITTLVNGVRVSGPDGTDLVKNIEKLIFDDSSIILVPSDGTGAYTDLGGDGRSDIILHNQNGQVAIWEMNGAQVKTAQVIGAVGLEWHVESTGDFTGDGIGDVVWRSTDGTVMAWQMNGPHIGTASIIGFVGTEWHVQGTGDLDGNGGADLVWRNDAGTLMLWTLNGTHIQSVQFFGAVGNEWHITGIGDFGGDNRDDILWRRDDGTVLLFQMNGTQIQRADIVGSIGTEWHVVGTPDLNGDGRADILFRSDSGSAAAWLMNGGQIQSATAIGARGNDWHVYGTGDFNGDGKDDILWRNDNGTVDEWLMNGSQVVSNPTITKLALDWTLGVHHYDFV